MEELTIDDISLDQSQSRVTAIHPNDIVRAAESVDEALGLDGQIVVGKVMLLSLSFDHRVVDGHVGAEFIDQLVPHQSGQLATMVETGQNTVCLEEPIPSDLEMETKS